MPLSAINFVVKGPVKSADLNQFYNLFTGVMLDQPVTFRNTLTLGGNQGNTTVPLKIYGAAGQTGHLIDLYADTSQAQPGFGFSAAGAFAWGPGGASPLDTFLSRVGIQNGHATDTAGLLVQPYFEVAGPISATSYLFGNGATISGPGTSPLQLVINQDLRVNRNVILGTDATTPPLIHMLSSTPQWLIIEALGSYATLQTKLGAYITANAYLDSVGWHAIDAAQPSLYFAATQTGFIIQSALAGANAAWSKTLLTIDTNGNPSIYGNTIYWWHSGQIALGYNVSNGNFEFTDTLLHGGGIVVGASSGNATVYFGDTSHYVSLSAGTMYLGPSATNWVFQSGYIDFGDTAHYVGWNGNQICSSHNFNIYGTALYFANSGAISILWNGGQLQFSQNVIIPGGLYFGSTSQYIIWNGTQITFSHSVVVYGADFYMSGSSVHFQFTGTWLQIFNHVYFTNVHTSVTTNYRMQFRGDAYGPASGPCIRVSPAEEMFIELAATCRHMNFGASAYQPVAASAFNVNSVAAVKDNIRPIDDALAIVTNSDVYGARFDYKRDGRAGVGFIADQWESAAPELVDYRDGELDTLDYGAVGAITFQALKEYVARTDARIAELEARLAAA